MKLDKKLEPFRAAIESLQRLLGKQNNRGVIIGGIAVGFLGKPRFTADVEDIHTIADKYPKLDVKRIRQWVTEFGEILGTPELWDTIKPLVMK